MSAAEPDRARYAVNTYSYTMSHTATDCLTSLAGRGHTEFELMMYPGHAWPADLDPATRKRIVSFLEREKLTVRTLNQPNIDINIAAATAQMRAYSLSIVRSVVELAGDLGAEGVIIGPGKANPLFPARVDGMTDLFFKALDELLPVARRAGTQLLVENMPFCFLPDADSMTTALERYGADEIGVVYDIANAEFIREDIAAGLKRVAPRLHSVHVSDTGHSAYRHDPVGTGRVPFKRVRDLLMALPHRRRPILEIIAADADAGIETSVAALSRMGWDAIALSSSEEDNK
ncbi:MAG: sugar phosphate isomerase/epimerase [Betaproteobacteria bacterium]|nr:sugar phosphate isomerase/epimerase [Betaproteobacteria bacterium]MBI3057124.1 sugar phosphate isomerase/epimerase [Betaproteobacteria bacterium]